ncbi:NAD(P)H-binding protein [Nocardia halotolerans]|uniref:NAD(P)H-binding protein n=1 Tax=Nocardia halotolerans TaxID=1755878 RepID=A0ABV8VLQ7_9NOCA
MHDSTRRDAARSGTILVTGATGNVGREVVAHLATQGRSVRRLDRRQVPDAESVVGDLTDPTALRAALVGVDTVFLIWPLLDAAPAQPLIAELGAAAPHVIYLSSTAIDDDADHQSDPIVQVHADMEALLRSRHRRLTVLRSDTLASNTRGWRTQLRSGDVVAGPDIARTAVVDERDIAAAAVSVMLGHNEFARDTYSLTGPELLTRADQAHLIGTELGRNIRFEPVPPDLARDHMLTEGRPKPLVDALITASAHRPESTLITDHVERLTGRPAHTFAQWVTDHRSEFTHQP